ncbi:GTP-binding protein [Neptuniibacter sp. QD72_48]|uniref:GTP-binding protein n=1 Tax=unclassified Neptuniibacter TaxID=2630693 RepID=UPI0039F5CDC7
MLDDKKIIFFGSVGAGKTTAIRTISEIDCVDTDANTSDSTSKRKKTTTVAMDYGYITTTNNQRIHCYGAPGQERFQFMWEIITTKLALDCSGLILFLDNTRNYPQHDLKFYTQHFRHLTLHKPLIVAVTKSDEVANPTHAEYKGWLNELNINAPIYFIDAREKEDILFLLEELVPTPRVAHTEVSTTIAIDDELNLEEVIQYSAPKINFSDKVLGRISLLKGVKGIALISPENKLNHSTLETHFLVELLQFLTSDSSSSNKCHDNHGTVSVDLRTENKYHYIIHYIDGFILAVLCFKEITQLSLKQQIENILQW